MAGWIDGVLDKFTDQIGHRVAGSGRYPTVEDFQAFATEVRFVLHPDIEGLITKLVENPDSLPKQAPTKGKVPVDATADLLNFSLLGAKKQ